MYDADASLHLVAAHARLDDVRRQAARSPAVARTVAFGLPALGLLAALAGGLPPFAALMAACFLLAAALVCHQAVTRFAGRTLRLLVSARVVVVLVTGAVLCCATGTAWAGLVSALLVWLTAGRLLGRPALDDLARQGRAKRGGDRVARAAVAGEPSALFQADPATPAPPLDRLKVRRRARG